MTSREGEDWAECLTWVKRGLHLITVISVCFVSWNSLTGTRAHVWIQIVLHWSCTVHILINVNQYVFTSNEVFVIFSLCQIVLRYKAHQNECPAFGKRAVNDCLRILYVIISLVPSFSQWCPMKAPTYASDPYPALAVAVLKQALDCDWPVCGQFGPGVWKRLYVINCPEMVVWAASTVKLFK